MATAPLSPWHPGERAVQQRLGEIAEADRNGSGIRSSVPEIAAAFVAGQSMVVIAALDRDGRAWVSLLTGPPGFVRVPRPDRVVIAATPLPDDPLAGRLTEPARVGLLAIEPATRRRTRINGQARPSGEGLVVEVHQAFANCPKYIQQRTLLDPADGAIAAPGPRGRVIRADLSDRQQDWLRAADTFFLGTADEQGNADASHRGGNPGFVEVIDRGRFRFPDYAGNSMYMTLGNLEQRPAAGFLFVDWTTGTTLQVTGQAHLRVDARPRSHGTSRLVEVDVEHVVEMANASPLSWGPPTPSRFNPPR